LGAARAGFRVAVAVDSNRKACEAHAVNFPKCLQIEADLYRLSGLSLLTQTNDHLTDTLP